MGRPRRDLGCPVPSEFFIGDDARSFGHELFSREARQQPNLLVIEPREPEHDGFAAVHGVQRRRRRALEKKRRNPLGRHFLLRLWASVISPR